jgi:hypothetical protein
MRMIRMMTTSNPMMPTVRPAFLPRADRRQRLVRRCGSKMVAEGALQEPLYLPAQA